MVLTGAWVLLQAFATLYAGARLSDLGNKTFVLPGFFFVCFLCFFLAHPWPVVVPGLGITLAPPQRLAQQWQRWILNPLNHRRTPAASVQKSVDPQLPPQSRNHSFLPHQLLPILSAPHALQRDKKTRAVMPISAGLTG